MVQIIIRLTALNLHRFPRTKLGDNNQNIITITSSSLRNLAESNLLTVTLKLDTFNTIISSRPNYYSICFLHAFISVLNKTLP